MVSLAISKIVGRNLLRLTKPLIVFYDTKVQHSQGTRTLHIFDASCADEDPNRKPIRTACEIVEVEFVAERGIMPNLACNFVSDPLSSSQTIFSQPEGDAERTPHVLFAVSPIRGAYTVRTVGVINRNPLVLN